MKGWGSWTGIGVKEKKVDPKIELQKKMKKIVNHSSLFNSIGRVKEEKNRW
jgi:hypothetical protein